jgi:hypothetical protein
VFASPREADSISAAARELVQEAVRRALVRCDPQDDESVGFGNCLLIRLLAPSTQGAQTSGDEAGCGHGEIHNISGQLIRNNPRLFSETERRPRRESKARIGRPGARGSGIDMLRTRFLRRDIVVPQTTKLLI